MCLRCDGCWHQVTLKHRRLIQLCFVAIAISGYLCVLGNYAISNYQHVAQQGDRPLPSQQWLLVSESAPPSPPTNLPDDLTELEQELAERRQRVATTCAKYGLDARGKQPNAWEFLIQDTYSLVWCNVFKAASSTWMYYFNLLGGYKEQYLKRTTKVPLILARLVYPRPSVRHLRNSLPHSLSFLIVREPFQRLLSAYRNKIESYRHGFYRKMAQEIILRYRQRPGANNQDQVAHRTVIEKSPTFSEFVDYVTDETHQFDEHWAPIYKFCTPCQINFTVIAKLETFQRDQLYIIRKAKLEALLKTDPKAIKNKGKGNKSTSHLVDNYYSQLTTKQLNKLYAIYGVDFEMFGYNATKYFHLAI